MIDDAVLVRGACLATVVLGASPAVAQTWSPTAAFSVHEGNPRGAWSYGWSPPDATDFRPYSKHTRPPDIPMWGGYAFSERKPAVWLNIKGGLVNGIVSGQLALRPGPLGEASVLRWTSPPGLARGWLIVTALFSRGDSGVADVAVRVNGVTQWTAKDSGVVQLEFSSREVQTVDFAASGAALGGDTGLNAWITFVPACPADFNQDGGVDGSDLEGFLALWSQGLDDADVNDDGGVDGQDVQAFFDRWESGC